MDDRSDWLKETELEMSGKHYYTDEKNAQIVIALLKAHGIKRVIASPGTSNLSIVGSVQFDPWFTVYSAIDERHAAYMACGMAAETGEPVVLSCTGASASRNYLPAMTEAYYRKLPVLAITAAQPSSHQGNLWGQFLDRSAHLADATLMSVHCKIVKDSEDAKECELNVNRAILELTHRGGGPVHINLETTVNNRFATETLPHVRKIERFNAESREVPKIPQGVRIAVLIGARSFISSREASAIDRFTRSHNSIVLSVAPRMYNGCRRINPALICAQKGIERNPTFKDLAPELIIHIGEILNDYAMNAYLTGLAPVWRISPDGELRDRFGRLEKVFEMSEATFFEKYATDVQDDGDYYKLWLRADARLRRSMPDLPFSNLYIAKETVARIKNDYILHLGVSSTLQSWNAFLTEGMFPIYANVGCCGIDGCVSAMIGGALSNTDKIHIGVVGDLTFFYDLNSLGNRHISSNVRILLVNNGGGALFYHPGHVLDVFGDSRNDYFAAGGHFGNMSHNLVKHYAEDLGFEYLTAISKESFLDVLPRFLDRKLPKPVLLECFTAIDDEREAWAIRTGISPYEGAKATQPSGIKRFVPTRIKNAVKALVQ